MKPLEILDEAVAEIAEAVEWYEERQDGLGDEFRAALVKLLASIQHHPRIGELIADTECRQRQVEGFPYKVVFHEEQTLILIVAVAHTKRRRGYWVDRLPNN